MNRQVSSPVELEGSWTTNVRQSHYLHPNFTTFLYPCLQALDKMENEWTPVVFEILSYKETGTYIVKASDDISQLLDDHIVMTQSMSFSPYKKPFEDRISVWENKLRTTQVHCLHFLFPSLSCIKVA